MRIKQGNKVKFKQLHLKNVAYRQTALNHFTVDLHTVTEVDPLDFGLDAYFYCVYSKGKFAFGDDNVEAVYTLEDDPEYFL